jgi:hypothetical protein
VSAASGRASGSRPPIAANGFLPLDLLPLDLLSIEGVYARSIPGVEQLEQGLVRLLDHFYCRTGNNGAATVELATVL